MEKKSVCIVGSGNWGSAISKIIGNNVREKCEKFEERVPMYMYEEMVDGRKLTEIVNTEHENVKYLPGYKIPDNVVALPDVVEACKDADILIFVLPHQFVKKTCDAMKDHVKKGAIAVSLTKGFVTASGAVLLLSDLISSELGIRCAVLMGANLAPEVAQEQYSESTIGCSSVEDGDLIKYLFETPYFRCSVVTDYKTVEICGALKNVIGIGAGIVDGLKFGDNTKAAVIRLGLMEMVEFGRLFIPGCQKSTFLESCSLADLVATCYAGQNRKLGEAVVQSEKTIRQLEKEILRGQSFQGPKIAHEVHTLLQEKDKLEGFPIFTAIYKICQREMEPAKFIDCLRDHPEHV